MVEARAQFAPGVGGVARIEAEREAAAVDIGLVVAGRVEALRLDRRVRRDPAEDASETIAAFERVRRMLCALKFAVR